jgi:hypothetical protein
MAVDSPSQNKHRIADLHVNTHSLQHPEGIAFESLLKWCNGATPAIATVAEAKRLARIEAI